MAALQPISVRTGVTVIEGGTLKAPWVLDLSDERIVKHNGGATFLRLSSTDRKLAALVGADLKDPHPLCDNSFLHDLQSQRERAIAKAIVNLPGGRKYRRRKDYLEHIGGVVEVPCATGEAHMHVKMIVPSSGAETVFVELKAEVLEFVKAGIAATLGVPSGRRKRPAIIERFRMDDFPNVVANRARPNSVYVFYTSADGRVKTHWESYQRSDIESVNEERFLDACEESAKLLQQLQPRCFRWCQRRACGRGQRR